ncbi:MAG: hypothetical protein HRU11_15205, partial [Parvularculaceae bacterium]|nr:hypothetical protein [Parvularculaceae bacterium]
VKTDDEGPKGFKLPPVGGLAILFVTFMFFVGVLGGARAPRPESADQASWLLFTDREIFGLEETVINGVWRNVAPSARGTLQARHCGLRLYGVRPGSQKLVPVDLEEAGWERGDGERTLAPPLWIGKSFCDMEAFAAQTLRERLAAALSDPTNYRISREVEMVTGEILRIEGVSRLSDATIWMWFDLRGVALAEDEELNL